MLFADLRGWTSFVDAVEPEELMRVLGEFHDAIGRLVERFEATVGLLEGDGVQLFFNDPIEIPDAPLRAVRLGLRAARGDGRADTALAEARVRARLRRRASRSGTPPAARSGSRAAPTTRRSAR